MQIMSFDLLLLSQSRSDHICFIPLEAPGRHPPLGAGAVLVAGAGGLRLVAAMSEHSHLLGQPRAPTPATPGKAGACGGTKRVTLRFLGWATEQRLSEQQRRGMKSSLLTSSRLESSPALWGGPIPVGSTAEPVTLVIQENICTQTEPKLGMFASRSPGFDLDLSVAHPSSPQAALPSYPCLASTEGHLHPHSGRQQGISLL